MDPPELEDVEDEEDDVADVDDVVVALLALSSFFFSPPESDFVRESVR